MSGFDPERYSQLDSPLHNWEGRTRLISLFLLIFSIVIAEEISQALAGLAISILLVLISGLPLSQAVAFIKWPFIFLLPILLILPITTSGENHLDFGLIKISQDGLHLGLLFMIRGLASAFSALIIVGTAHFNVNINAMRSLGMPGSLTQIFLFTYRYVFLLYDELQTMRRSLQSKGFEIKSNARSAVILATAIAMLLIRSYERSEDVFNAMLSRGYNGRLPSIQRQNIGFIDLFKCALICLAAVVIHFL
jgi:cobalt/nickel transport system permease protein